MAGDAVNHPSHYNAYQGIEIIDLCEQMNFNKGNAVKYITRAGLKNPETEVQDLEKAVFYLQREIARVQGDASRFYRKSRDPKTVEQETLDKWKARLVKRCPQCNNSWHDFKGKTAFGLVLKDHESDPQTVICNICGSQFPYYQVKISDV